MNKNYKLVILLFFFILNNLSSQKEEYNWYFGTNAGLDFTTSPPTATTNSAMSQWEGCAVASDRDGNLMFYTSGVNVYNKNHQLMANGAGLLGHNSSTHSAFIVSHPGNKNRFYIFTSSSQGNSDGLRYSVVDMTSDGGLGEIISKNNLLYTPSSEKILCIKHANGKDFWVITHELNSNRFRIFAIDKDGLNTTPTIQGIGRVHTNTSSTANAISYIRSNSSGQKIALAVYSLSLVELFDFDNSTGVLSNPIALSSSELAWIYGLEFSPDDTKLYVSKLYPPSKIYQIDLTSNDASQMLSTMYAVDSSTVQYEWGALKKGPDGKIYIARDNKTNLSIINNPNQSGAACNFAKIGISLNNKRSGLGLPTFLIWSDGYPLEFNLSSNSQICEGDTLKLFSTFVTGGAYNWTGPNGFVSTDRNPVITDAKVFHSGDYTLNLTDYLGNYGSKNIRVIVNPKPKIDLTRKFEICSGDAVNIGSKTTSGGTSMKYFWQPQFHINNPNIAEPTVNPDKSTIYYLTIENEFGCQTLDSVQVIVKPKPSVELGKDIIICFGDTASIGASANNGIQPYMYKWFPEDGLSSAYVDKPLASPKQTTMFILTVTDKNGCITLDSILVTVNDKPIINAGDDISICYGQSVRIPAYTIGGRQPVVYKWSNSSTLDKDNIEQPIASPLETTKYFLKVIDANGCLNYDTITINVHPKIEISAGKDTSICVNSILNLNGSVSGGSEPYQIIEWFPKENLINPYSLNPIFQTDKNGVYKYQLKAIDSKGCTNQSELNITVKAPSKVNINKNSLNFGTLDACQTLKVDSLLLVNDETEDVIIESININGDFRLSSPFYPIKLKPKEKLYIRIVFSPTTVGEQKGRLTIITGACSNTYIIDLIGSKSELILSMDKNNLDFGRHLSCDDISIAKSITLTNNGTSKVTVDTRQISLKHPFKLKAYKVYTIESKDSLSIEIEFTPDLSGVYTETVIIPFNSKDCSDSLKIDLYGASLSIKLSLDHSNINFPGLIGCENQYDSLINIHNDSEINIDLVSVEKTYNYSFDTKLPLTIEAGKTISIPVRFSPKDNGQFQESPKLIFEPCHIPIIVNLSGGKSGISVSNPPQIDFGNIITCNISEVKQKIKIKNTSDSKTLISLDSIKINAPFSIKTSDKILIMADQEEEIDIYCDVSNIHNTGLVSGSANLYFSPCEIVKTIDLKANLLTAELLSDGFKDLGIVTNITSETIEFYNRSLFPILISEILLDNSDFIIQDLNFPIKVEGNDTLMVELILPMDKGVYQVKVTAKSDNPCNLIATSERKLEIKSINARTYVSLPEIRAKSGETVNIPLTLDSLKNSNDVILNGFNAVISFNKYLLEPINQNYEIIGDSCYLMIRGFINNEGKILSNLRFLVLLGDTDYTSLSINQFIWDTEAVEVVKQDGSVRIINECYNTTRFVKNSSRIQQAIIKPNPVNDYLEIEYQLSAEGYHLLYLTDINGKIIKNINSGYYNQGSYKERIYIAYLSAGLYNLVFFSEDGISSHKILIIK